MCGLRNKFLLFLFSIVFITNTNFALAKLNLNLYTYNQFALEDTSKTKKELPFNFKDRSASGNYLYDNYKSKLTLDNPSNIKEEVIYNPKTGKYEVVQKIGNLYYRPTNEMTLEEYLDYDMKKSMRSFYKGKVEATTYNKQTPSLIPKIIVPGEVFDKIFGSNVIDIRPSGSIELTFGANTFRTNNPAIPIANRVNTVPEFQPRIQFNVTGKIGERFKLSTNYNTESTFDFENLNKLEWEGNEDDILQKIEAGNIALPLQSSLITGAQNLLGVKTTLRFGKLDVTSVFSQNKSQRKEVTIPPGGGQLQQFQVKADEYEANKHYFLSQYFFNNYDNALANLPFINTQVNITRLEVYVTNRTYDVNNRNIVGFMDLGEPVPSTFNANTNLNFGIVQGTPGTNLPDNTSNNLINVLSAYPAARDYNQILNNNGLANSFFKNKNFILTKDFDLTVAKKLQPNEYTFNPRLGFVSLNQQLNADEILAVAYQYTINGKVYQVGEFSTDGIDAPQSLYLKLLKASITNVKIPTWDLMMKNVYALGAFQIQKDGLRIDIVHTDVAKNIDFNFIAVGNVKDTPLVRVFGLDRLNNQQDPFPDGVFDVIEGITINLEKGRLYFPSVAPFGNYLAKKIGNVELAKKYAFQQLYDSTRFAAQLFPEVNRFKLVGKYKASSGADISLNALNIPQGSVTVTVGAILLKENVDYTVNYSVGSVKIINDAILNSGQPIKASYENNNLFSINQKTLWGANFDYRFNKDMVLGGTFLHSRESPLTQKININEEPISNSIYGFHGNYSKDAPWLTRIVDKLPFFSTKEASSITANGEFAQLLSGQSKIIGGNSYIDDFEGSQSTIDLRSQFNWSLASIPQGQPSLFSEANLDSTFSNFKRSLLSWYTIDPIFFRNDNNTPANIRSDKDLQSNHYMRIVQETELFPNKNLTPTQQLSNTQMFDMAFYPAERGPYNFTTTGIDTSGKFLNPRNTWSGIQRRIETTDFENANIQFVQFWMMDPFNEASYKGAFGANATLPTSGNMYLNLGDVSEDLLKDNRMSFESGLPKNAVERNDASIVDSTAWGIIPKRQIVNNAFDNDNSARPFQDVGYDGLDNPSEQVYYNSFLQKIAQLYGTNSSAYQNLLNDASSDNYSFYRSKKFDDEKADVIKRYKFFTNADGNSRVLQSGEDFPTQATITPNNEDINRDNTLNRNEAYYQYQIKLTKADFQVGRNNITNVVKGTGKTIDGKEIDVDWYQFKIPIREPSQTIGNITDFRSIRFMRMFLKDFNAPVVLRFGRLEFLRGDWRKFNKNTIQPGEYITDDEPNDATQFNIGAVNLEENGERTGVSYVLPPGIQRQQVNNTNVIVKLNEQSLSLSTCNLKDGEDRAAFKSTELDVRMYKKLKMFLHAEKVGQTPLNDNELLAFVRLGTDFDQNYYEYELPLKLTPLQPPGQVGTSDPVLVWPTENNIEIEFAELQRAKLDRNKNYGNNAANFIKPYVISADKLQEGIQVKRKITVVGNPNVANLKIIMIGLRNPKRTVVSDQDNGLPICAEVWANEMRLTDFDDINGWAALANVQTKLADLGSLNLATSYSTPGFGNLEQRLNERYKETTLKYDASANFEVGKFLPKDWNIRIPLFLSYGEQRIIPRFNPLDPDIEYNETLDNETDEFVRNEIKAKTLDRTIRRSMNFTNIHKERGKKKTKSHFYDVENWALTYAYSDIKHSDINLEFENTINQKLGLNYNFNNTKPLSFAPFANTKKKWLKKDALKIIRDFNIGLMPTRFGFRTDLDRQYQEQKLRNNSDFVQKIIPTYFKNFVVNRNYDYAHDFTKALRFTFNASNAARIDELNYRYYKPTDDDKTRDPVQYDTLSNLYKRYQQNLVDKIKKGGRNTSYKHSASLDYTLPFAKIPILNWITSTARYTANYDWTTASLALDSLGKTIQNSNAKQANATLNLVTLYNKFPFYKKLNAPPKPPANKAVLDKKIKVYKDSLQKKEKHVYSLQRQQEKVKAKTNDFGILKAIKDSLRYDKKRLKICNKKIDSLERALKVNEPNIILTSLVKIIFGVKNANISYTESNGTLLPGLNFKNSVLGLDNKFDAPGWEFIGGIQDRNIAFKAAQNSWLVKASTLNTMYTFNNTKALNLRASVEPIKDVRIDLTASRQSSLNHTELFRYESSQNQYVSLTPIETGTFSISTITWKSAFTKDEKQTYNSEIFQKFLDNRAIISKRLGEVNTTYSSLNDSAGFSKGYRQTSQEVLIPAFLSAYTGTDVSKVGLSTFKKIPLPNWRITYDGLSRMKIFKNIFKTFSLNHAYRSNYSVGAFTNNLLYTSDKDGFTQSVDKNRNFQAQNIINNITIIESFAPFLGADITLINNITLRFEYKKDRNLNMNFSNLQLTEIQGKEVTVGGGYRFKDVKINFMFQGTKVKLKSDINVRADVSVRNNKTIIRKASDGSNQPVAGQTLTSIKVTADYQLNEKLSIQAFYDRNINTPFVNSIRTSNAQSGIRLRFTLAP